MAAHGEVSGLGGGAGSSYESVARMMGMTQDGQGAAGAANIACSGSHPVGSGTMLTFLAGGALDSVPSGAGATSGFSCCCGAATC